MCNLGTAIESKARDEGRAEGRAEGRNEGVDLMAKLVDILMEADRYADVKKVTMLKKVPVPGKNKYLKENWYKKLRGKDNSLTDSIQKKCLSPAKKYKLYKSSINKSLHFAQRSLSRSTRGH